MQLQKEYENLTCWGLVFKNKSVLLLKKFNAEWGRPGGKMQVGETPEECIIREIKEETNITAEVEYLQVVDKDYRKIKEGVVLNGFILKYKSGEPKNVEPEKHEGVRWFSLDNLPINLKPRVRELIEEHISPSHQAYIQ